MLKGAATAEAAAPKAATDDKTLVQTSWARVSGDLQAVGELFYSKLFAAHPELKTGLFGKSDMKVQPLRLMQMVDGAVGLLGETDKLVAELLKLGERHYYYGVRAEHYPIVGEFVIATLAAGLGEHFTEEVKGAWLRTYGVIQDTMLKGAATAEAAAATK
jgi:hemoglobin-like flavoprotein